VLSCILVSFFNSGDLLGKLKPSVQVVYDADSEAKQS